MLKSWRLLALVFTYAALATGGAVSCGEDESDTQDVSDVHVDEGTDPDGEAGSLAIEPGTGIGPVRMGMTYGEIKEQLREPSSQMGFNRMVLGFWDDLGLDVVFASSEGTQISEDALVVAVGAKASGNFEGAVLPGMSRSDVIATFGESEEVVEEYVYYESGFSVKYAEDGQTVEAVGVFEPYERQPEPPKMVKSGGNR